MAKKTYRTLKDTVLLVDDDPVILRLLENNIQKEGYRTLTASTLESAQRIIAEERVDIVLLDVMFPEGNSIDLCAKCIATHLELKVIMMTSSNSVELAVEAMKVGAFDYVRKPVEFNRLYATIAHALDVVKANKEIAQLRKNLIDKYQFKNIIGESKPMKKLFENMTQLLNHSTTVLIQAESGTGKELVAKAIHFNDDRAQAPFVAVNCAAIPENLIESELFGHEKGSFTGANTRRIGKFEQANGGTIFLDEIGEMSLSAQARWRLRPGPRLGVTERHYVDLLRDDYEKPSKLQEKMVG